MKIKKSSDEFNDIDILGSIEFDLTESIKDLIYNIKLIKEEVIDIKKQLPKKMLK